MILSLSKWNEDSLENERIALVIKQIADYGQQLQKTLLQLADNFDYTSILKALT